MSSSQHIDSLAKQSGLLESRRTVLAHFRSHPEIAAEILELVQNAAGDKEKLTSLTTEALEKVKRMLQRSNADLKAARSAYQRECALAAGGIERFSDDGSFSVID